MRKLLSSLPSGPFGSFNSSLEARWWLLAHDKGFRIQPGFIPLHRWGFQNQQLLLLTTDSWMSLLDGDICRKNSCRQPWVYVDKGSHMVYITWETEVDGRHWLLLEPYISTLERFKETFCEKLQKPSCACFRARNSTCVGRVSIVLPIWILTLHNFTYL